MAVRSLQAEAYREYDIPGRDKPYRITNPVRQYTTKGETTHTIVDAAGVVHCVPFYCGVILRWLPAEEMA